MRTTDGHLLVRAGSGNDTVAVGTHAGDTDGSTGTVDSIRGQLAIDAGTGTDRVVLDDAADLTRNLGTITQTSVTGLGMVGRTGIDRVYSVEPQAGATTFRIYLPGVGSAQFASNATAQVVHDGLMALLYPTATCGRAKLDGTRDTRCADSVFVWQVGGVYLIGFRGELDATTTPALVAQGTGGVAEDRLRVDGVTYAGMGEGHERLDVNLGSAADVVNVRGTVPVTNLSTGAGDDRVYVSSDAAVGLDDTPEFLTGHLDDVDGTLNLDAGAGRHTLLISDEASRTGDGNVVVTRSLARAQQAVATALDVAAAAQIFVTGLATGAITYATTGQLRRRHPDVDRLRCRHHQRRGHPRQPGRAHDHLAEHRPRQRQRDRQARGRAPTASSS